MPLDDARSRALRKLTELAAKEQNPEKLRQLVLGINNLLDVIVKDDSPNLKGTRTIEQNGSVERARNLF